MNNCPNCGGQIQPGMNNCPYCGTNLNNNMGGNNQNYQQPMPNQNYQQPAPNQNYQQPMPGQNQFPMGNRPIIKKRDIVMAIIYSIITCGIYGIYWFVCLTDDSNALADSEKTSSGGVSFLLTLVTCGIYGYYWAYKMGKKLHEAGQRNGIAIGDNSILYIIFTFFGLGIVTYIMAQSDINKFASE